MVSSFLPEQDALTIEPEASSSVSLLECGLNRIRQGHYIEGVTFFNLARELLSSDQMHLAAVLDTFIQGHFSYWQAQQVLQQASKRFVEIEAEQQARVTALEELLSTLMGERDTDSRLPTIPHPLKTSNNGQLQESSLLPVGTRLLAPQTGFPSYVPPARIGQVTLPPQAPILPGEDSRALPALYITCFGRFEVRRLGQTIILCTNRNGQAILRCLVAQPEHRATMDMLMAVLWPEDEPEIAHHKLQVAASALRRSLNRGYASDAGGGYILCKNRVYQLNPLVPLRSDVGEFLELYQAGRQSSISAMVTYYERACDLYIGPFLTEDLYADWSFTTREQLSQTYLAMCNASAEYYLEAGRYQEAMRWIGAILRENRCDEVAHRQLIRAYAAQGHRSEALRHYQHCARILAEELGVKPMPETVKLFHAVLNGEFFSTMER